MKVIFVDNFDSFTFNLVEAFAARGCDVEVFRNTAEPEQLAQRVLNHDGPSLVVLSPGPGSPDEAGCCAALMALVVGRVPVFGICLGHQVIVEHFGGTVERAQEIVHGKTSVVRHDGQGLFQHCSPNMVVGRYHSLCANKRTIPDCLEVSASIGEMVMAVRHREAPVYGVQFHPESILTRDGGLMFDQALEMVDAFYQSNSKTTGGGTC